MKQLQRPLLPAPQQGTLPRQLNPEELISVNNLGAALLDHQDNLCQIDAPPSRPLAVTCKQCSHSYTYKEENGIEILVTTTKTCSAHRRRVVNPENARLTLEKKKKAEFLISKIDELIELGSSLEDSLQWLGVSESRYQKLRSRVEF